jgi:hypothetical protein
MRIFNRAGLAHMVKPEAAALALTLLLQFNKDRAKIEKLSEQLNVAASK